MPKRKPGALPSRVLDFNQQGANVAELVMSHILKRFAKGTAHLSFWPN